MSTRFITEDIWPTLTSAIEKSARVCHVAVAYFGQGASKMLPLPSGSRLIVDAGNGAVKLGLTCPDELIKLQKGGVRIFSLEDLHAKVYVVGNSAFIGSANVSRHSAGTLIEALLHTTEPSAVRDARQFVADKCRQELGPEMLKELREIYRPPHLPGGKRAKPHSRSSTDERKSALHIAQLPRIAYSEAEQREHDAGLLVAKRRRKHPRSFVLDDFMLTGNCSIQRRDMVVQVVDEGNGVVMVSPPGNVLYVRSRRIKNHKKFFVYLEYPRKRRSSVKTVAKQLGLRSPKRLREDGIVHDALFAQKLMQLWNK